MKNIVFSWFSRLIHYNDFVRKTIIVAWHVLGISLAHYFAFMLRFEGFIPAAHIQSFKLALPVLLVICILVFAVLRLYSGIWAYFSMYDVYRILVALSVAFALYLPSIYWILGKTFRGYPRSTSIISFILIAFWMTASRMAIRFFREFCTISGTELAVHERSIIVGTLSDVDHLMRSIPPCTPGIGKFVGIITDEKHRHKLTMRGVPVLGDISHIATAILKSNANNVLILPPYTTPSDMKTIIKNCEKTGVKCKFTMIPSMTDLASGKVELSMIRNVEIEDLLGRPQISLERETVKATVQGKSVLVTGAGGSIGSELVRQLAQYAPSKLILFEVSEFNLYNIDMEIREKFPHLTIDSIAGDIRDTHLVKNVLTNNNVQIVFHAAAYKHVPMMEHNVCACINNNAIGTANLVEECENADVDRFVFISTDKAVRPTSVMGASKRLAEQIIQQRPASKTTFVMVRFGNVLGSSGSVIPLFKKQIREGGPVTVTTPNMTRFFMSIPEAVDLVLQAGSIGKNKEILVLEMGEPMKILTLAQNLIELSGFVPDVDIKINFSGLRPGEKEYEELITDDENVVKTPHSKIWTMIKYGNTDSPVVDLTRLQDLVATQDKDALRKELLHLIPEASPSILSFDTSA